MNYRQLVRHQGLDVTCVVRTSFGKRALSGVITVYEDVVYLRRVRTPGGRRHRDLDLPLSRIVSARRA